MKNVISPLEEAASLTEFWSPRVIADLDDSYVKVARLKGTLAWHSHDDEDELFLVLKGQLRIEFENGHIDLQEGDLHVVPKGVQHNPVARDECLVMLIERKSTLHTGRVKTPKTRDISEQLSEYEKPGQVMKEKE
jgi:mannose-6-phosphate isomerase-like protein (cupin superfamily)